MLGLDRKADGTGGLTPAEHQQIIRSEWAADGIMSGCEVIASSTDMSVTVRPGAVVLPTSGIGAVQGSTPQTRIVFDPAPATGTDVYDIFVKCENTPGATAQLFAVKNGPIPPLVKRIERWNIPAGVTNAAAGFASRLKDYAVPVGASQSVRVFYEDKTPFGTLAARGNYRNLTSTFYLPQERILDFRICQTFSSQQGSVEGSFQWRMYDSVHGLIASPVLRYDAWANGNALLGSTQFFSHIQNFAAGWHTMNWDRTQVTGAIPMHAGGTADGAAGTLTRPYNRFEILDLGIAY